MPCYPTVSIILFLDDPDDSEISITYWISLTSTRAEDLVLRMESDETLCGMSEIVCALLSLSHWSLGGFNTYFGDDFDCEEDTERA